ncbi:zf-HC2 domain-containing protein [Variovorax terrae]|uniref:Zf-HC2 domain-containing protein n=1 Tax=Variovorax terrae TaxID=2923278 RepID=A0A9X1W4L7_9BURK|nr:zf-HC2 domain-containing protein [Variovorax terrae]MCJ0765683.1 zf-HC2 domain-containing protein [Variovorax terrae]
MILRRTCKQVAALLIAREDRALPLAERVALRLHLLACHACPRFERQLLTMRNAMRQWRHYTGDDTPGG